MSDINGVINLYKPKGITSQSAVNRVKKIYGAKKIGHCGTLDPNAEGVLICLLGNATKAEEYLVEHTKRYTAELVTGIKTDSGDITGNIIEEHNGMTPSLNDIENVLKSFVGIYAQIPPMYSALKKGGVKLVNAARKGIVIEREPRNVTVYSARAFSENGRIYIDVKCSRGTYMRVLCEDIGAKLNIPATMGSLVRTELGKFSVSDSVTLESLSEMTDEERLSELVPVSDVLPFEKIDISDFFFANLIKNGCAVNVKKLSVGTPDAGKTFMLYENGSFFAVGQTFEEDGEVLLKHTKMFL